MIQTKIEDTLAEEILSGNIKGGDVVDAGIRKDEVHFTVKINSNFIEISWKNSYRYYII